MKFLDCGCCLKEDGTRTWCPTCASGPAPAPSCPCGGEGYPGIAHDLESMRRALRLVLEEATAPADSFAEAERRLHMCASYATDGLNEDKLRTIYDPDDSAEESVHRCTQCGKVVRTPFGQSPRLECPCPKKMPWQGIMTAGWIKAYERQRKELGIMR